MLETAYLRREATLQRKRAAENLMKQGLIRIQESQNGYVGSRQEFFEAHNELEETDKLIQRLISGDTADVASFQSSLSEESSNTSSSFDTNASVFSLDSRT